jgi:hypothetical protein
MANNNENHLQRTRICDRLAESKLITFSLTQRMSPTTYIITISSKIRYICSRFYTDMEYTDLLYILHIK